MIIVLYGGIHLACVVLDCHAVMDLCFIVDSSASICDTDPRFEKGVDDTCDNWNAIVTSMYRSVARMDIGENAIRVGLVLFATKAYRRWDLTRYGPFCNQFYANSIAAVLCTPATLQI